MAVFEIIMPKLGESIIEATITKWLVKEGETLQEDDPILEIATDKVDSEIPSPIDGILKKINYNEGDTVAVGAVIALLEMEGDDVDETDKQPDALIEDIPLKQDIIKPGQSQIIEEAKEISFADSTRFYSPLVKSIAKNENISVAELDALKGSGKDGRLTKKDILIYVEDKKSGKVQSPEAAGVVSAPLVKTPEVKASTGDEVIEMDRMRKLIADHMVMSKQVSPHVTMFHEVDMTNAVIWRNGMKNEFLKKHGTKITFTPIFIEAAAKALRDFPLVNASVNGYNIIKRHDVNIGMATALPNGNLIVPVIRNADQKNLVGLARDVNDLATRARASKLGPDEISGGTFTVTNFGQFGNLTGAPIINQPQVAILGIGTIKKKAVVVDTPQGDVIAIRHIMILSMAFDHRIVDGALGGMFLQKVAQYLEYFDIQKTL